MFTVGLLDLLYKITIVHLESCTLTPLPGGSVSNSLSKLVHIVPYLYTSLAGLARVESLVGL